MFLIILTVVLCVIYVIMLIHHTLWLDDINLICKIKGPGKKQTWFLDKMVK